MSRTLLILSSFPQSSRSEAGMPVGVDVQRAFVKRFPFSVFYLLEPAVIWVVAFAHHRRRPGYWKERLR